MSLIEKFSPVSSSVASELESLRRGGAHAFLFLGGEGVGKLESARVFAGLILAARLQLQKNGDVEKLVESCVESKNLDVRHIAPVGSSLVLDDAKKIAEAAGLPSYSGCGVVVIVERAHDATEEAAASLLKLVEEPPKNVTVVLLSEYENTNMETLASRCVKVFFPALSLGEIADWLQSAHTVSREEAERVAGCCSGNLRRAEMLLADSGFEERQKFWQNFPDTPKSTGYDVYQLACLAEKFLLESLSSLAVRHSEEESLLKKQIAEMGLPASEVKKLEAKHKQQIARYKQLEVEWAASLLVEAYKAAVEASEAGLEVLKTMSEAVTAFQRGSNDSLALQQMILALP